VLKTSHPIPKHGLAEKEKEKKKKEPGNPSSPFNAPYPVLWDTGPSVFIHLGWNLAILKVAVYSTFSGIS
jgi:hypothetical protein